MGGLELAETCTYRTKTNAEWRTTRVYKIWAGMKTRCNPKAKYPHPYAQRGIRVCERWLVFSNFVNDVGEIPDGFTLDRIDPRGNYEPSNCRLATMKDQSRNTTRNVFIVIDGVSKCASDWAEIAGISASALLSRYRRGMTGKSLLESKNLRARMITVDGKTQSIAAWSRESGLSVGCISHRLNNGATPKLAITARPKVPLMLTLTVQGRTQSLKAWAKETGLCYQTLKQRVHAGWPPERCLAPSRKHKSIKMLTVGALTQSVADWARQTGLLASTIRLRIDAGWDPLSCIQPSRKSNQSCISVRKQPVQMNQGRLFD